MTKALLKNKKRRERGQSVIESTLILLTFCFMIFGAIDFAVLAMASNSLADAVGQGARYASLHGTTSPLSGSPTSASAVQTYVQNIAATLGVPNSGNVVVNTTWPVDQNIGSLVRVTVTYNYQPMVLLALKTTIPIAAHSERVIQQ